MKKLYFLMMICFFLVFFIKKTRATVQDSVFWVSAQQTEQINKDSSELEIQIFVTAPKIKDMIWRGMSFFVSAPAEIRLYNVFTNKKEDKIRVNNLGNYSDNGLEYGMSQLIFHTNGRPISSDSIFILKLNFEINQPTRLNLDTVMLFLQQIQIYADTAGFNKLPTVPRLINLQIPFPDGEKEKRDSISFNLQKIKPLRISDQTFSLKLSFDNLKQEQIRMIFWGLNLDSNFYLRDIKNLTNKDAHIEFERNERPTQTTYGFIAQTKDIFHYFHDSTAFIMDFTFNNKGYQVGDTVNFLIYMLTIRAFTRSKYDSIFFAHDYYVKGYQKKLAYQAYNLPIIIQPDKETSTSKREKLFFTQKNNTNLKNYPNPVIAGATTFSWNSIIPGNVRLDLYDLLGNRIKTITNKYYEKGLHKINADLNKLNHGVYIYNINIQGQITTNKLIVK